MIYTRSGKLGMAILILRSPKKRCFSVIIPHPYFQNNRKQSPRWKDKTQPRFLHTYVSLFFMVVSNTTYFFVSKSFRNLDYKGNLQ